MKLSKTCLVIFAIFLLAPAVLGQKAGKGSYDPIVLPPPVVAGAQADNTPFAGHYIRLEASTWFMKDQDSLLSKKTISGTIEIHLGDEKYQLVMGSYPLSGGNQTAPLFNRAILDYRAYTKGDLRLIVFIKGIKTDKLLGRLLKNVASSAIGIAGEKLASVTTLGFSSILTGAQQDLFQGVQEVLRTGEDQYEVFAENNGLDFTIQQARLTGKEKFYLAYRGNPIRDRNVAVTQSGDVFDVTVDGAPLREGAWILFRIAREDSYGNPRAWQPKAEKAMADVDDLMQNWSLGAKTQTEVQTALTPTLRGETIADKMLAVRAEVRADEALTFNEKSLEAARLVAILQTARDASQVANGFTQYFTNVAALRTGLRSGTPPPTPEIRALVRNEMVSISTDALRNKLEVQFADVFRGETIEKLNMNNMQSLKAQPDFQKLSPVRRNQLDLLLTSESPVYRADDDIWKAFAEVEKAKKPKTKT